MSCVCENDIGHAQERVREGDLCGDLNHWVRLLDANRDHGDENSTKDEDECYPTISNSLFIRRPIYTNKRSKSKRFSSEFVAG